MVQILKFVVLFAYIAALYYYVLDFTGKRRGFLLKPVNVLQTAIVIHLFYWGALYFNSGKLPIGSLFGALTTFVLLISLIYMFIEIVVKDRSFGIFLLPLVILLQGISSIFIRADAIQSPILENAIFEIHVISMIVSYSAFSLGAIAGVMHLLLSQKIKRQKLGILYINLPSLQFLSQVIVISVYFGFVFLTAGMLLGFFNAFQVPEAGISFFDPKIISVILTWAIYGYFILRHSLKRLGAKESAYLSLVGFLMIFFTFFVVNILMTTFHLFP